MPPNRAASPQARVESWAFKRAHPLLTTCLITSARLTQPLLLLSLVFNSNLLRRTPKQRVAVWYLAYFSFYSRHILALVSLGWLLTGGERRENNNANAHANADGGRNGDGQGAN